MRTVGLVEAKVDKKTPIFQEEKPKKVAEETTENVEEVAKSARKIKKSVEKAE